MVEQGVDERVFLVPGSGMHDQSGGLVQHQQRFVLEQNIERHFLGLRFSGFGFRPVNFNLFTGAGAVRGLDDPPVDLDMALFYQPFQRNSRDSGKLPTQECIESLGWERFFNN
jgi:hypothetical protein